MKILVCGGREYNNDDRLFAVLNQLGKQATHIIHGAAKGADFLAGAWARANAIPEVSCPANWGQLGRRAGFVRNTAMLGLLDPSVDFVLAFPGGKGTGMMMDIARKAGVKVVEADTINRL